MTPDAPALRGLKAPQLRAIIADLSVLTGPAIAEHIASRVRRAHRHAQWQAAAEQAERAQRRVVAAAQEAAAHPGDSWRMAKYAMAREEARQAQRDLTIAARKLAALDAEPPA